jgi:hypothetical protein
MPVCFIINPLTISVLRLHYILVINVRQAAATCSGVMARRHSIAVGRWQ